MDSERKPMQTLLVTIQYEVAIKDVDTSNMNVDIDYSGISVVNGTTGQIGHVTKATVMGTKLLDKPATSGIV